MDQDAARPACLNCGTSLIGKRCHECGQAAHVHKTLSAFLHDLLHGILHFEGKIWRTLPMLFWRPGELTRRYVEGERARFVSPVALFLFSAFLMFVVFSAIGGPISFSGTRAGQNFEQNFAASMQETERRIAVLERQRGAIAASAGDTRNVEKQIESARTELSLMRTMQQRGIIEGALVRLPKESLAGPDWLRKAIQKAQRNPSLLFYKLQNNAYKFSWALIPISVPLLWLLFPFSRRFGLYQHTVFVTYSLSFVTSLAVALSLLRLAGLPDSAILMVLLLIPPIHMYRQLKGAYLLGWSSALWRTLLLVLFALLASLVFMVLLLALGIIG